MGYYDMKQLIERLSSDVTAWTSAADKAIVYWRATPKNYSGMIHAMFPVPKKRLAAQLITFQWKALQPLWPHTVLPLGILLPVLIR